MPRPGRLFLPLDAGFPDDDRIIEAGERPGWLYVVMCCAAKRLGTDGILTERQLSRLNVGGWRARLDRLIAVELVFDREDGSYAIASWFRHNEPQAVIEKRRADDADRKRRSARNPAGIQSDSGSRAEQSSEEQSSPSAGGLVDEDCEHGVDRFSSCMACAKAKQATG